MHKWRISAPEYTYLDLKCQENPASLNEDDAKLIIYGVKHFVADVDSSVYDSPYIFENGDMVMPTDINMNNHDISVKNPTKDDQPVT